MNKQTPEPTVYFRALWEARGREIAKLGQGIQRQRQAIRELRALKHNEVALHEATVELSALKGENSQLKGQVQKLQEASERLRLQHADDLVTIVRIRQAQTDIDTPKV